MSSLISKVLIIVFANIQLLNANELNVVDTATVTVNETVDDTAISANSETVVDNKNNEISAENKIINSVENNLITKPKDDIITISPVSDDYYKDFSSFMLGNSTIKIIQKALSLNSNKSLITNETVIDESGNIIQKEETFSQDVGNIYLKSIMYISKNFWSVWINDIKITNSTNLNKDNEFIVKNIDSKKVDIIRRVSKTKWSYINSNNKITSDEYKIVDNNVEFEITLSPNQTFVASKNKIIEGKYVNEEELLINSINNPDGELNLDAIFNAEEFDFTELNNF